MCSPCCRGQVQLPPLAGVSAGARRPSDTTPTGAPGGGGGGAAPAARAATVATAFVNPFAAAQASHRGSGATASGRSSLAVPSAGGVSAASDSLAAGSGYNGGSVRSKEGSTASVRSNAEAEAAAKVRQKDIFLCCAQGLRPQPDAASAVPTGTLRPAVSHHAWPKWISSTAP